LKIGIEASWNPHNMLFGVQHMEGFILDKTNTPQDTIIISLGFFGVLSLIIIK
jgi:hypothetical protein